MFFSYLTVHIRGFNISSVLDQHWHDLVEVWNLVLIFIQINLHQNDLVNKHYEEVYLVRLSVQYINFIW